MTEAQRNEELKAAEHELQKVQDRIKNLRETKIQDDFLWVPKMGCDFWDIDSLGVTSNTWHGDEFDQRRLTSHNVFKTKAQAQQAFELLQNSRLMAKIRVENDESHESHAGSRIYNDGICLNHSYSMHELAGISLTPECADKVMPKLQSMIDSGEVVL